MLLHRQTSQGLRHKQEVGGAIEPFRRSKVVEIAPYKAHRRSVGRKKEGDILLKSSQRISALLQQVIVLDKLCKEVPWFSEM